MPVQRFSTEPSRRLPRFTVTPTADERLVGEGDVELAARRMPTYTPPVDTTLEATRPRLVSPPEEVTPSPYEQAQERYNDLLTTEVEDRNGRGRSALYGLARGAGRGAQSGSVGYTLGAGLGGALLGLIRPQIDEEERRATVELPRAQAALSIAAAAEKQRREQEEAEGVKELRAAQTRQTNVETELLPKKTEAEIANKRQAKLIQQLRVAGRYKRGENPALDQQLDEAGLNVSDFEKDGKFQWHEAGGQVFTMDAKTGTVNYATAGDKPIVDASKVPNAKGLTPYQAETLAQREKLTRWQIDSREKIAAAAREIQQQRISLSKDQFAKRYPGAGRPPLTASEILTMAQETKRKPTDVAEAAIKQGYTIDYQK